MGGCKGQISMEYLMVAAFAFLLLVPIIIIAYSQSARFSNDVGAAQIQRVANTIVDTSNTIYYAGPPSKKTIKLYFPDNINQVLLQGNSILFTLTGDTTYEYAAYAEGNMTGSLQTFSGIHVITIEATTGGVNVTE